MVTFWLVAALMVMIVTGLLANAMTRDDPTQGATRADYDISVYRAQLDEIARDVARGVVPAEDAERLRTEISRRILATDGVDAAAAGRASGLAGWVVGGVALALIVASFGLYLQIGQPGYGDLALQDRIAKAEERRKTRPSQAKAEASLTFVEPEDLSDSYAKLVEQLRQTVADRPDDLQGHQLLAQSEANIGNFPAAARAQANILRIKGEDTTVEDMGNFAELLVLAAGGYVSPEAEVALRQVLVQDDQNPRARYYYGLMMIQIGRPDISLRLWDGLLRRGPADAPWIEPIQEQIMPIAELAGVRYTMPPIGGGTTSGPSADDLDAASQMTPAERMEMIGSMVSGLSDRLATEGGPPQDWARLITSLGVLNERAQALAVFNNALEVFQDDPNALDVIRTAGEQAGIAG